MNAHYDKVIVIEDETGFKKAVVIFDNELHVPVFFGLKRFGMDEVLELFGTKPPVK